jgi:hypothetical protein
LLGDASAFLLTAKGTPRIFPRQLQKHIYGAAVIARPQTDALRGSLDLLVLKTLSLAPMHGWGISLRIQQISEGVLDVNQGSLYPPCSVSRRKVSSRASGGRPTTIGARGTTD